MNEMRIAMRMGQRTCVRTNLVYITSLAMSLSVVQWLEHPNGVQEKVMEFTSVGELRFFLCLTIVTN